MKKKTVWKNKNIKKIKKIQQEKSTEWIINNNNNKLCYF